MEKLPKFISSLLIVMMFIRLSRMIIDSFIEAYQLFGDIWAPIIEACLNLGGSILLGYIWGLNGVLVGVILSLIIIILLWKPYYLFRYGMKSSVVQYFVQYVLHLTILLIGAFIAKFVMNQIYSEENNLITTGFVVLLGLSIFITITYVSLLICTKGMRMFTFRIRRILANKI